MFGRRRRARVASRRETPALPVPAEAVTIDGTATALSPDDVYELVSRRVAEALGPNGRYSLVLRSANDTDEIFSTLATRSLSLAITQTIVGATEVPAPPALHSARTATESALREHTAVAVWADPHRHDPDSIDPAIVFPPVRSDAIAARTGS